MPIVQNPSSSALVKTQNAFKTYTKDKVSSSWVLSERFICTSISEGRGLIHSTASFQFIAKDMTDTEGLNNMRTEFAQASGLILGDKFVYKTRFVMVVEEKPNTNETKFMGCLTGVSYSSKQGPSGKYDSIDVFTAMGVDWMLSQVHLIGGYFIGIDADGEDVEKHTSFIPPVLNIKGQGNKSKEDTYDIDSAGINIGIFNYSNDSITSQKDEEAEEEEESEFNAVRWTVDSATKYMLYQLAYNRPKDGGSVIFDCYEWYREMFIQQVGLEFDGGADSSVFDTEAQYMNDINVSLIPAYDLIVQMAEGSGKSTTTIRYEDNTGDESRARIVIIN